MGGVASGARAVVSIGAAMSAGWRERLARAGYSAVLGALKPLYLLRLWWRGRLEPLYRHRVAERLARYGELPAAGWVWLHAVSLGETRAAAALVEALRLMQPG